MNANFSDIATGLSNVLTRDNQAPMTAPLRLVDGSLPQPGLAFANDTNTGFRRSAADEMRWVAGGLDRMFIDAAGKMWALGALDVVGAADFHALVTALLGVISRSDGTALQEFLGERYQANTNGGTFRLRKSRNATIGAHTIVQSGDTLGIIRGEGSDGAAFVPGGDVTIIVDGAPGAGDMPGALVLSTTPDGSAVPVERMAIRADGRVQIPNRAAPLITFNPAGFADLAEIAVPANPAADVARLYALDIAATTNLAYRKSDGTTFTIGGATQAQMEAAASADFIVTPARQHFHPGHPKAGGNFDGSGVPAFRAGDYGMGVITDNGVGNYTLALDTAFENTNYWVLGMAGNGASGAPLIIGQGNGNSKTTSAYQLQTVEHDADNADGTECGVSFWGNYA